VNKWAFKFLSNPAKNMAVLLYMFLWEPGVTNWRVLLRSIRYTASQHPGHFFKWSWNIWAQSAKRYCVFYMFLWEYNQVSWKADFCLVTYQAHCILKPCDAFFQPAKPCHYFDLRIYPEDLGILWLSKFAK